METQVSITSDGVAAKAYKYVQDCKTAVVASDGYWACFHAFGRDAKYIAQELPNMFRLDEMPPTEAVICDKFIQADNHITNTYDGLSGAYGIICIRHKDVYHIAWVGPCNLIAICNNNLIYESDKSHNIPTRCLGASKMHTTNVPIHVAIPTDVCTIAISATDEIKVKSLIPPIVTSQNIALGLIDTMANLSICTSDAAAVVFWNKTKKTYI